MLNLLIIICQFKSYSSIWFSYLVSYFEGNKWMQATLKHSINCTCIIVSETDFV